MWKDSRGRDVRAETRGPAEMLLTGVDPATGRAADSVITNIGAFAFCRRDRFCRCRKCKPPLADGAKTR